MTVHRGQCHCGAVAYEYQTALATAAWPVRACECAFCVKHGATYTSDPSGSVKFTGSDPSQRRNYRFGHHTADFVFCSRCGGFLGAVMEEGGGQFAVLNLRVLDPMPVDLPAPKRMSYEDESAEERVTRRSARWTPVKG